MVRRNMNKRETIDWIMRRNPSAAPEFLAGFNEDDLAAYLRQLESLPERADVGDLRFGQSVALDGRPNAPIQISSISPHRAG